MANKTDLVITHRTIEYSGDMYPLQAVSRVFKGRAKTKRPVKGSTIFGLLIAAFICAWMTTSSDTRGIGVLGMLMFGAMFCFAVYKNLQPTTVWALVFEVGSTYTNVVWTRSEQTIDNAINTIRTALHSDGRFETTVHFNSGQIVNAEKIEGGVHYNNRDSKVAGR